MLCFRKEMVNCFNKRCLQVIIEKDIQTRKTAHALVGKAVFHNKVGINQYRFYNTF